LLLQRGALHRQAAPRLRLADLDVAEVVC